MADILDKMRGWVSLLPPITLGSILEIVILTVFVYECLLWIKNSKAWQLLKGLLVIGAFITAAAVLRLTTIMWLIERVSTAAIIGAIVIFQPELRKALEQIGTRNFFNKFFPGTLNRSGINFGTVNEIVKATFAMSKVKTGALIVIQQSQSLREIEDTGIRIDGIVSSGLLINIFEKNTPLHDGAVCIVGDRVTAATCYLPLSATAISKDYGTRHRAALGVSETNDSVTIVVSEETGRVSVAEGGKLVLIHDENELRDRIPMHQEESDRQERHFFPFDLGKEDADA